MFLYQFQPEMALYRVFTLRENTLHSRKWKRYFRLERVILIDSRWSYLAMTIVMLGILVVTVGCGQDGPQRYNVSGKVTFQGKPVPVGQILFQPDISQGNSGPSCVVGVKNGFYDTSGSGNGHVGGPHVAVVSGGADQSNLPPEEQGGGVMFREVQIKLDLPKSESTQDIEVPAH